jgi:hypothetical protein
MTQNTVHHGGQPVVTGKDLRTGFEELGLPSAPAGLVSPCGAAGGHPGSGPHVRSRAARAPAGSPARSADRCNQRLPPAARP